MGTRAKFTARESIVPKFETGGQVVYTKGATKGAIVPRLLITTPRAPKKSTQLNPLRASVSDIGMDIHHPSEKEPGTSCRASVSRLR